MPRFSDEEILDILINDPKRENEVLEFLYTTHYSMIKRLILNKGGNLADVQDVFQEAILVLHEKINSGQFRLQSKIKPYLYTVSRNLWIDRFRKTKNMRSTDFNNSEFDTMANPIEEAEPPKELIKLLQQILEQVGEDCKRVLVQSIYQQRSMKDIALEMNYENEQVARNKKYRCLEKLKKYVQQSVDLTALLNEWR